MTIASIGDDVQFWAELSQVRLSKTPQEQIKRAEDFLVPYIDSKLQALRLAGSTSIGDDAQFRELASKLAWVVSNGEDYPTVFRQMAAYIDSRAPAAQASATIQAAPAQQYANEMFAILCRIHTVDKTAGYRTDLTDSVEELLTRIVATPAATIQEPVMVAEPVEEGWPTNAMISAGFKAGMSGKIGSGFRAMQAAAPMVADPAGVAVDAKFWPHGPTQIACSSCGLTAGESRVLDALKRGELAATVKAVPSEAPVGQVWFDSEDGFYFAKIDAQDRVKAGDLLFLGAASVKTLPSKTLDELRAVVCGIGIVGQIDDHQVIRRDSVIEMIDRRLAAPLADKTGGGE